MEKEDNIELKNWIDDFQSTGNQEHLVKVFMMFRELIFGVCLKYFRNEEDAKDATLEIYQLLSKKLPSQKIENFKPWLYVVVKNYCFEKLRKKSRQLVKENEAIDVYSEHLIHPDNIEKEELLEVMEKCMETLSEKQRNCINAFYYKKLSYHEAAAALSMSWNQVRSQIQNGRRNLKICIEDKNDHIR